MERVRDHAVDLWFGTHIKRSGHIRQRLSGDAFQSSRTVPGTLGNG